MAHKPSLVKIGFITVIATFLLLYGITTPHHLTGYGDAEEMVTVSWLGGVAHPPGYPLFTLILNLLFKIIPIDPVTLANLFNGCLQALSLGIMFVVIFKLLKLQFPAAPTLHIASISFGSVMITGLSVLYWLTATRIEVVTFTNLLVAVINLCLVLWLETHGVGHPISPRWLYLAAFAYGLGLSHMQTLILLLPGMFFILLIYHRNLGETLGRQIFVAIVTMVLTLMGFLLPQPLLFIQNSHRADLSWYFPQSLGGLVHHILRQDYSGNFLDENTQRDAYWSGLPAHFVPMIPKYLSYIQIHFSLPGILLIVLGIIFMLKIKSRQASIFLLFFIFGGLFLAAYIGEPTTKPAAIDDQMIVGIGHRQYLLGYSYFSLFIGYGLYALSEFIRSHFKSKRLGFIILLSLITLVSLWQLIINLPLISLANLPIIDNYVRTMLGTAKPNSTIVCSADMACFPLSYLNLVKHVRPDVTILYKSPKMQTYFLSAHPEFYQLSYVDNPDYVTNLIAWNLQNRAVYHTNPTDYYISYMGLNGDPFFLIPDANMFEIVKDKPKSITIPSDYPITQQLLSQKFDDRDAFTSGLKGYFSSIHTLAGTIYLNWGQSTEAKKMFDYSLSLTPFYRVAAEWLSLLPSYKISDTYQSRNLWTLDMLAKEAQGFIKNGALDKAYIYLRKATYLNPKTPGPRLLLAETLIKGGYPVEAAQELKEILLFNPDNQAAKIALEKLH